MSEQEGPPEARDAERMKFFTDAVVAIAMTLLILPLLEAVAGASKEGWDTAEFVHHEGSALFVFVLSFVIIASFWVGHERLFTYVGTWTGPLMTLNIGWMLSIVFLPVATALVGAMESDRLQTALYIGTMLTTSLLMAAMSAVVRRDPRIWIEGDRPATRGLAASVASATLFVAALVVAELLPAVGYFALFLLMLTGPLQAVLDRMFTRGRR